MFTSLGTGKGDWVTTENTAAVTSRVACWHPYLSVSQSQFLV
jgi:hypothetical protein